MQSSMNHLFSIELQNNELSPEFSSGDILIVDKNATPVKGSIVVASFSGIDTPLVIKIDEQLQDWCLYNKNALVDLKKLAGEIAIDGVVIYRERSLI